LVLIYRLHESYETVDADAFIEVTLGDE